MVKISYDIIYYAYKKNLPGKKLIYKILKLLVNVFYPILYRYSKEVGTSHDSKIIVSLTSFPARIKKVWITTETLLNQTIKPYKVILWLAEEQFDNKQEIEELFRNQLGRGLEIRYCKDLKSHKKYYYTMKEYPEYTVITADDDMFYAENMIEQLYKKHLEYPDAICCNWAHIMEVDMGGEIKKYKDWEHVDIGKTVPELQLMAVGCEGVLYPPYSLSDEVFNEKAIMNLCLSADDIWLKFNSIPMNTKIVRAKPVSIPYFSILTSQKVRLNNLNLDGNENDVVINKLQLAYPKIVNKYIRERERIDK